MDLTSLLGPAAGGIIGLVGGIATGVLNFFQKKQDHAFRIEELKLNASLEQVKTAGEITLARERGAGEAFTASQNADASITGTSTWVANLRGFTRPGLTWFFTFALFALIVITLLAPEWLKDAPPLLAYSINMVTDTCGMCVAWWFGSRAVEKQARTWGNIDASASVK